MPKLIHFLRKLVGHRVTLELKDDTVIQGSIVGIDSAMNTHVRLVLINRPNKTEQENLENMTIRGSEIRYIFLPDDINLDVLLKEEPKPSSIQNISSKVEKHKLLFQQKKF